jgi:hypothetical protein
MFSSRFLSLIGAASGVLISCFAYASQPAVCRAEIGKAQAEVETIILSLHGFSEMNQLSVFQRAYAGLEKAKAENSIAQASGAMDAVTRSLHAPNEMGNLQRANRLAAELASIPVAACNGGDAE